jgi:cytochrome b561
MNWGWVSELFHWVGAALVLYLLIHGFWMVGLPREVRFGHTRPTRPWVTCSSRSG